MKSVKQNYFASCRENWTACAICSLYSCILFLDESSVTPEDVYEACFEKKKSFKKGLKIKEVERGAKKLGFLPTTMNFELDEIDFAWKALRDFNKRGVPVLVFPSNHAIAVLETGFFGCDYLEPDDLDEDLSYASKGELIEYWLDGNSSLELMAIQRR